jgi:hypothetical protein
MGEVMGKKTRCPVSMIWQMQPLFYGPILYVYIYLATRL